MPAAANTASNAALNFESRSDEEPEPVGVFGQVHQQVAGRLRDPRAGRVSGDPGQVDPAVVQLDHKQHIQPGQADRFDGEEVAREGAGGLGAQKLRPSRAVVAGRRPEMVATQDGAHRRRGYPHAELSALADDAYVSPAGILPREAQHEADHLRVQRLAASAFGGVGPASADQLAVPA